MQKVNMSLRILFVGVISSLGLLGCASTPEGLKSNPDNKRVASTKVPYQLAFKRITEAIRECTPPNIVPIGQTINESRLYTDLKTATITLGASGFGTQIFQHLEITGHDESSTELVLFAATKPQAHLERYVRWAEGGTNCDV